VTIESHWRRPGLDEAILDAIRAEGKDVETMGLDALAAFDHFHGGGIVATRALAKLLAPAPGARVLDVGGGLGGPARMLALEHGCAVTVLDLTRDYLRAGEMLTAKLGRGDRVQFQHGDALEAPFSDGAFDVVWTQNSGMNIEDKARLYGEFRRLLRPGGLLAIQEPVAGPVQPPHFPLMWAADPSTSFLVTADGLRRLIVDAGFTERAWVETTTPPPQTAAAPAGTSIQRLIMADRLPAILAANGPNWQEKRLASVHGVFTRG
jgi:ubiquinone/menaquinone biosynthesis C-methylase UbiE